MCTAFIYIPPPPLPRPPYPPLPLPRPPPPPPPPPVALSTLISCPSTVDLKGNDNPLCVSLSANELPPEIVLVVYRLPIQFLNSRVRLSIGRHGDKSVPLLRNVDIFNLSALAKLILQHGLGTVPVDTVHEQLRHYQPTTTNSPFLDKIPFFFSEGKETLLLLLLRLPLP